MFIEPCQQRTFSLCISETQSGKASHTETRLHFWCVVNHQLKNFRETPQRLFGICRSIHLGFDVCFKNKRFSWTFINYMAAVSNIFNLATYCWWDSQVCIMICVYSFHWLQFKKVFGGLTGYLIKILQISYWPWRGEYLGTKTKPTTLQTLRYPSGFSPRFDQKEPITTNPLQHIRWRSFR